MISTYEKVVTMMARWENNTQYAGNVNETVFQLFSQKHSREN